MKDNYLIIYVLIQVVDQLFHCGVYPQFNSGLRSNYPFIEYSWIDPGSETTMDETNVMETTLQIDVQSLDQFIAIKMANELRRKLRYSDGYRRFFKQVHIIPHDVGKTSSRNFYGTNAVQRYGFDCSFSIYDCGTEYKLQKLNFEFNETTIDSIQAMNQMNGKPISADRKEEN